MKYPEVKNSSEVGNYPAKVFAGGGFVWDEVLEYRVWCHPEQGAQNKFEGDDYFYAFDNFEDALEFSKSTKGTVEPIALILQREYIDEPESGEYIHIKKERITEWPVEFLSRPRRTDSTIPDFLSPTAPENRLDILRGNV
ncbi:MAG: GCN5 family acetyltransferase [Balneola sp.]|nr:MAG: GCN5 family acetyltransferase [Balneola sp.]